MTLEQAMTEYLEAREQAGLSAGTLREERRFLKRYVAFCENQGIRKQDRLFLVPLLKYHHWLKKQPFSAVYRDRHMAVFFRLAALLNERKKRDNRDKSGTGPKNA